MARNNPSNPYTRDPAHTAKDVPLPVQKAKVMAAEDHPEEDAFHTVKIRIYGDDAPYRAPVLTPMFGSVWVPKAGQDVAVIFGDSNKPWVIGAWYPLDRVEDGEVNLPAYTAGDIILGNENGYIAVRDDGTVETSDTFSTYNDEDAQDAVGGILSGDFTYDDTNNLIDLSFDPATQTELDTHAGDADAHHTRYTNEEAEDAIAALLAGGTNVSLTYDDANGTLTIDTSALNDEEVQDTVSTLLTGGTGVSLNYDDANDTLTINGFSGAHSDLTGITSDDHHTRYSDGEAQTVAEGVEKFSFTAGHTEWGANVSNEEIHRIDLQAGETLTVQRVDTQLKGGGTDANLSFDLYDASTASVLMSSSAGSPTTGSATSSDGAVILVRVTNSNSTTTVGTTTVNGVIA